MATISDSIFLVTLPSGNRAVYAVQPQHVNDRPGTTLAERACNYGTQLAHAHEGRWYRPGDGAEITDLRTIALLERASEVQ
jgi:hypothetical protein